MKKILCYTLAFLASLSTFAQKNITLNINHKLGTNNFALMAADKNNLGNDFKISRVEYYISGISIIHDGGMITPVANKYILANGIAKVIEPLGSFSVTNVEGIRFSIGVDSPTNNGDPSIWPSFHPLAPKSPSMHWGWSSGYRFVALEGKSGATFANTFEMHGLWNRNYFQQTVMATGVVSGTDISINLDADYKEALRGVNVVSAPIDHGVDATDLTVLENFRDHVFSPSSGTASINVSAYSKNISIYPNPSKGKIAVAFGTMNTTNTSITVYDVFGKKIKEIAANGVPNLNLQLEAKGIYFISIIDGKENIVNHKLLID